nr:hypothetical protein CFP56_57037 [Quercus suber]
MGHRWLRISPRGRGGQSGSTKALIVLVDMGSLELSAVHGVRWDDKLVKEVGSDEVQALRDFGAARTFCSGIVGRSAGSAFASFMLTIEVCRYPTTRLVSRGCIHAGCSTTLDVSTQPAPRLFSSVSASFVVGDLSSAAASVQAA